MVTVTTQQVPITVRLGENTRFANIARNEAIAARDQSLLHQLGAELARDQAADLVLPENIFVDVSLATAQSQVSDGTTFKIVNSSTGIASVYLRTSDNSIYLYGEATTSALLSDDGATHVATRRPSAVGGVNLLIKDKARDVLSYRDFGIAGDTDNDMTSNLRNAIVEAMQHGQILELPGGKIHTSGIDLDPASDAAFTPGASNPYTRYGQVHIRGHLASSYPTNDKGGGTRLVHIAGNNRPLIRAIGTDPSNSVRQFFLEGLLLLGSVDTTSLVEVVKGTEQIVMRDNFLRIQNPAGNGYEFTDCYGVNIDGGRVFGTATTNGNGATGVGLIIQGNNAPNGLTTNMFTVNNLDIYRCGIGKRIGGPTLGNKGGLVGPVRITGGQSSNCDRVGTLIGSGARNITISEHHNEGCWEAGLAVVNQCRMIRIVNNSWNHNGKNGTSADLEIGFKDYHVGDSYGVVGITVVNGSWYTTDRPIKVRPGNNVHNVRFEGILDMSPTAAAVTALDVINNSNGNAESNFVSISNPATLFRQNGGETFDNLISDPQNMVQYRQEHMRRLAVSSNTSTVNMGMATTVRFSQPAANVITSFSPGVYKGQTVVLEFSDGNTTIQHDGSNINLAGATNYVGNANSSLVISWDGAKWVERRK